MFFFIKLCTDEEYPLFLWREREEGREGREGEVGNNNTCSTAAVHFLGADLSPLSVAIATAADHRNHHKKEN